MILFAFIPALFAAAATLAPSAASDYKYVVPKTMYWPIVNGVGMGETASFVVRFTDVAWLGNAIGEFDKMRNDFLRTPRVYSPYYQYTNTYPTSFALLNPRHWMDSYVASGYYVNYRSASSPIPEFLDGNKSISVPALLPSGYNGTANAIWTSLANVSSNDTWRIEDVLFSVAKSNYNNRVLKVSTITNSYWSVKKLHSLKFVSQNQAITLPSTGYTDVTDGQEEDIYYSAEWNPASTNWVWKKNVVTNTTFHGSIPSSMSGGNFQYIAYAYYTKSYKYHGLGEYRDYSPMQSTTDRFEFYNYYSITSGVPRTHVVMDPIALVYNENYERIGTDISWQSRIDDYRRISCFEVKKYVDERFPATDSAGTHTTTNYTQVKYVFLDTSSAGMYVEEPASNYYVGAYNKIARSFIGYGSSKGFLSALLGSDESELAVPCGDPREPQDDGTGYIDYADYPSRKVIFRVSHLWSIATVRPHYTCTFDGN